MTKRSALRELFPHTNRSIYLNHAAVSPLSRPVLNALETYQMQRHRDHVENFDLIEPIIDETRDLLGQLLGTTASRIDFAPNTSSALSLLANGLDWQPGDRIAIPGCEFPANVYPFMNLIQRGVAVDFIPHDEGVISLEAIEQTLTKRTRLLSISWVQFLSGFRIDLNEVSRLCKSKDVLFSVDAIQGLGAAFVEVCG